jgi:DNA-binding response OmpR family regulator
MNNSQKPKIAIIEDEPSLSLLYEYKLQNEGFEVRTAADGIEGLQMIKEFQPSLILLDLRMPLMNGDEMLQHMRSESWGSDIRVIIMTNISKDEAPRSLRFLGVDRYIVKAHHTPTQVVQITKEILHL